MSNGPIVFGSIESVNKYKKSNGIKIDQPKDHKPVAVEETTGSVAYVIGGGEDDQEVVVTEEEINMLNNIKLRNNPDVICMQEDFSFYDDYYLSNVKIDDVLLAEARKIRRIYRDYEKYMYACYIREKYLSCLEEKYGTDTLLRYTKNNTIMVPRDVFIPPYPIYSKNAKDYDAVMSGTYTPKQEDIDPPSEEELMRVMDSLKESLGRNVGIETTPGGILTFRPGLALYDGENITHSSKWSGPSSVSVTDLDSLQKMIRSWHRKEDAKMEQTRSRIPFPKSEEGIKQWYLNELAYVIEDYMAKENQEDDENEMTYDEISKKPMTKKELNRRKTLRMLANNCGWDMVKLMSQLNVGSKMERKVMRNKQKGKKKAIKKATDFMSGIMGETIEYDYESPSAMSGEELMSYLFND